jgi:catechol 2,3-dioxygenase-like lactoylglutathione lyase family enzyme
MAKLHHVLFHVGPTFNEVVDFYETVIGITGGEVPLKLLRPEEESSFKGEVKIITDGDVELHFCDPDYNDSFKTGDAINRKLHHHAFVVDDIEAAKARLRENDVPFVDKGFNKFHGRHQVYFHDPAGNVCEFLTDPSKRGAGM